MKKLLSIMAGLALVAGNSTAAQAQSCGADACTVDHTVTATVPTVLNLTLSSITTALTNPVEANFDDVAGIDNAGPVVTLKSNVNASVTISSPATWTGGAGTKASTDLGWRITAPASHGTGVSATPTPVIGIGKGNRSETIIWNTLWNLATDEPDAYSLVTTFTLVED